MLEERIERARYLLKNARNAALATVNEDGSPHNTPYFFMIDEALEHLYWSSHPASRHSRNVGRTGQIFVVLHEANVGGGLYIQGAEAREVTVDGLDEALASHNKFRLKYGKEALPIEYYEAGPQKMYKARAEKFWVNLAERDKNGRILRDYRQEISRQQLLKKTDKLNV